MLTASLRLPTYTISYLCYDRAFFKFFFIHVHHFSLKGYFQISEQMYSHFNLVFFSSSHLWVNKLHVSLSWKTFTVWHLVFHIECALNSAVSNVKKKFSPWLLFSSTQVTDHRIWAGVNSEMLRHRLTYLPSERYVEEWGEFQPPIQPVFESWVLTGWQLLILS